MSYSLCKNMAEPERVMKTRYLSSFLEGREPKINVLLSIVEPMERVHKQNQARASAEKFSGGGGGGA